MATLTTQNITRAGLLDAAGVTPAGGGDQFQPGDDVFLRVKNGSGGAITCTVTSATTGPEGQNLDSPSAVSIAAGATRFFGPFPSSRFAAASGYATVTCSATASVEVTVFRCAK